MCVVSGTRERKVGMDLKVFCEDSSAHGLKKIVSAPSKVSRAFWSVVCMVAVMALLAHLYIRLIMGRAEKST